MKYFFTIVLIILTSFCFGQTIMVDQTTKDTIIITEVTQTFKTNTVTRKTYKPPVIVQPPAASKYFLLPVSNPIILNGQSNVIIDGKRFDNSPGVSIKITNCKSITIKNCFFNRSVDEAIVIENSIGVTVQYNLFAFNTTGVYATTSQTIKVTNNQFLNMRMRSDNSSRGQFVQFNNVTGTGNDLSNNKGENFHGESNPEDMISLFKSSGTAASPILVKNNMFRGGGPSASGGGIVLGDYGGSYIIADGNVLHTPGNYGMAISGGHYMTITNNKIFSKQTAVSNNPLFIWAQQGATCSNNVIRGNRASWINKAGVVNGGWDAKNCTGTVWEYPTPITEAELNMPSHLIDYVTPEELLKIRGK